MKIFNCALFGTALSQSNSIAANRPLNSVITINGDENPDQLLEILKSVSGKYSIKCSV